MRLGLLLLCCSCLLVGHTGAQQSQITVHINGLRNTKGVVRIALYDRQDGFPYQAPASLPKARLPITASALTHTFPDVPSGTYGISLLHDENDSGNMDYAFFFPKEGFGFSNNMRPLLGPPSFEAVSFSAPDGAVNVTINVVYY